MSLKPIETVYKGYRFRSRLEARWAVFFDAIGLEYLYEDQGFELPSGRYLPDFFLPTLNCFFEVKPAPKTEYRVPSVYMAGRMGVPDQYNLYNGSYRPFPINIDLDDLPKEGATIVETRRLRGVNINYTGPWTIGTHDHCLTHGQYNGGEGVEGYVFRRSMDGIRRCDVLFAYFEDGEAFGTLVEVGYAKAAGKKIIAAFHPSLISARDVDFEPALTDCDANDMWFAAEAADHAFVGDKFSALDRLADFLRQTFPTPAEVTKMDDLCLISNCSGAISYGDPASECFRVWGTAWQTIYDSDAFYEAALKARQARFEFGQVPA